MRVSDEATVEVAKMVLLGKVNSDIVMRLNRHGQPVRRPLGRGRRRCSAIAPHAKADEVGFVGEIERVDVDVLNHIAADYIPVIASVGADREGNSYNVNADTAAGKVAARSRRPQGDLPHRRRGLARRPGRRGVADLAGDRRRGRGGDRARSPAACGRSSAPASRRSAAASARPTSSTAAAPTASCSSSSPGAGIGTMVTP